VEDIEPPPEIGPHEGRELELMLAGKKPLAYFSELTRAVHFEWPDVKFDPYVRSGEIVKRDYLMIETIAGRQEEVRWVFFALPDQDWRIDAAYRHLREEARTKNRACPAWFEAPWIGFPVRRLGEGARAMWVIGKRRRRRPAGRKTDLRRPIQLSGPRRAPLVMLQHHGAERS
jgi:hypothetical protein